MRVYVFVYVAFANVHAQIQKKMLYFIVFHKNYYEFDLKKVGGV